MQKKILAFCSKLNPQKRNNVPSSTDGIYESGAAFSENLSLQQFFISFLRFSIILLDVP
jgi:hypothetical protein